jgi:hypothetical protein
MTKKSGPVASLATQIKQRTVALDPKYEGLFIHTHMVCKCNGDVMVGGPSSGYATNYNECLKCGRNFFRESKIWRDLLEDRVRNRKKK